MVAEGSAAPPSERHPLRVAIIGAGPAGIFAADALTRQDDVQVSVDLIDRLPTPFGLVRHGIAPDHPKMRAIRETLHRSLDQPLVRFVGNVDVGVDVSLEELREHVDAVVYTYGAALDRRLGIEGEDLPGSLAATDVVAWYCGHPDADRERIESALTHARSVVVVGVGNVALDVARVLARAPEELEPTDMPQHVLDALAAAPVERVTILGRRGPAQASFTTQELRELDEMTAATVLVDPADLELDAASEERAAADRVVGRNLGVLRGWADHVLDADRIPLRLSFFRRPVRLVGEGRVTGIEVERTAVDGDGRAVGTGETEVLPADLVVRSVGYRGTPLPGLPVDESSGTVPHDGVGRVLRDGQPSAGEYVAGWIKRGPSGVVGTNKHDARETVDALLADAADGTLAVRGPVDDLVTTLRARGAEPVLLEDWRAIDAAEVALGATRGRARTTMHEREALLAAIRAATR
ncbi:FAD-dependent oxidoreductase [Blastococcus sp. TML/M2B]|uniref:FAD-dependent oxidoreductase n=1 Tax=unclassified Blastococcus TaxID=2619396 RepID=UPI00190DE9B3|nr:MULTISPECIES: FAD-dependent oxidoreductase [unclassified Blastococcus]MBN1091507.1 FAD-dependent oxidoreductase [Blastococcus sp. TML/M2B]MBN1094943.1 FAD-dependent oxidoreductase [Blastococcus sp. TML/C7B]